ncbi:FadR family transcriptional regulator [Clostridium sp. CX1]|uniref:FadR/GntR family transcriptional regulator n=1 Tax=Clostridium sp. CX1 TaxID=2978346 RepID=UPI0021C12092|nr:FadR/GntR family transcriptional regulator [Clostridium sp. CX1]MCT8975014.1 FadR family transcriptional regulator [Clostridium sp. CX1]
MSNTIKNTRVYEQVIEKIKDLIEKGELGCGDKLPSERDLCEQLNVSRTSVREALRVLGILGIVECKIGEGNFIKDNFEDSLLEPLSMTFMLHGSKTDEILDLRKFIEPGMAALAAKNINDEQLQEIKEIVDLLNSTEDEEKCAELDKKLHYKIVQASGNYLVSNMMFAVSTLVETYIEDVLTNMFRNVENKNILKKQHKDIIQAIEDHDSVGASVAMLKHLEYSDGYISKTIKNK